MASQSPRVTRRTTASVVAQRASTRRTARQNPTDSGERAVGTTPVPVAAPRTTRSVEDRLEAQPEEESIVLYAEEDDDLIELHEDAQVLILPESAPQQRPLSPLVVVRQPPVPARRTRVPLTAADEQPMTVRPAPSPVPADPLLEQTIVISDEEVQQEEAPVVEAPAPAPRRLPSVVITPARRVERRRLTPPRELVRERTPVPPTETAAPPTAHSSREDMIQAMDALLAAECRRWRLAAESATAETRYVWDEAARALRNVQDNLVRLGTGPTTAAAPEPRRERDTPATTRRETETRHDPERRDVRSRSPSYHSEYERVKRRLNQYRQSLLPPLRHSPPATARRHSPAPARTVIRSDRYRSRSPPSSVPIVSRRRSRSPIPSTSTTRHRSRTPQFVTPPISAAARIVPRAQDPEDGYYERRVQRDRTARLPAYLSAPATITSEAAADRVSAGDLRQVLNLQRAPPLKLMPFGGNVLEYPSFVASLRNCLEPHVPPGAGLTPRLLELLTGEAREVVGEVALMDDEEGYCLALERLEKRYGQPASLADRWRKRLATFSSTSYRAWTNKLLACVDALSATGVIERMGRGHELQMILQRVPEKARNAFADLDNKARLRGRTQPGLIDLLDIMEEQRLKEEAREAYRPTKRSREDEPDDRDNKRRRGQYQDGSRVVMMASVERDDDSSSNNNSSNTCQACNKANHAIEKCPEFWRMSVPERRKCVGRSRLCFVCFRAGHRAIDCGECCNYCGRRHHVMLHEDRDNEGPAAPPNAKKPAQPPAQGKPSQQSAQGKQQQPPNPGKSAATKGPGNNNSNKDTAGQGKQQCGQPSTSNAAFRKRRSKKRQGNKPAEVHSNNAQ